MCESQHVAVKMYINYSFFTFIHCITAVVVHRLTKVVSTVSAKQDAALSQGEPCDEM